MTRELSPLEKLLCALMNFKNYELLNPGASRDPVYQLARSQLKEAIEALSPIQYGETYGS